MKVSNGYFKHPVTGEVIKPGEMYQEFDKRAVVLPAVSQNGDMEKTAEDADMPEGGQDGEDKPEPEIPDGFTELSRRNKAALKKLAKDLKIEGYQTMSRDELTSAIIAEDPGM